MTPRFLLPARAASEHPEPGCLPEGHPGKPGAACSECTPNKAADSVSGTCSDPSSPGSPSHAAAHERRRHLWSLFLGPTSKAFGSALQLSSKSAPLSSPLTPYGSAALCAASSCGSVDASLTVAQARLRPRRPPAVGVIQGHSCSKALCVHCRLKWKQNRPSLDGRTRPAPLSSPPAWPPALNHDASATRVILVPQTR